MTRIGLKCIHNKVRILIGTDNAVNMRSPNMRRQQPPLPPAASFLDTDQHQVSANVIKHISWFPHPVNRPRILIRPIFTELAIARQMAAIAAKRNQINHTI